MLPTFPGRRTTVVTPVSSRTVITIVVKIAGKSVPVTINRTRYRLPVLQFTKPIRLK